LKDRDARLANASEVAQTIESLADPWFFSKLQKSARDQTLEIVERVLGSQYEYNAAQYTPDQLMKAFIGTLEGHNGADTEYLQLLNPNANPELATIWSIDAFNKAVFQERDPGTQQKLIPEAILAAMRRGLETRESAPSKSHQPQNAVQPATLPPQDPRERPSATRPKLVLGGEQQANPPSPRLGL
jgi:hypothetical protein